jgi:hypothetical protein
MTTTIQELTSTDNQIATDREIIKGSLNEIAEELRTRLQEVHLNYPVYLAIPNSGQAIVQAGTHLDPSDDDWKHITRIVQEIISNKLGKVRLTSRDMMCATTTATMSAVDLTAE